MVEDANWLARVDALRRYPASLWKLLQRKDRPLQTVEPRCALAWPFTIDRKDFAAYRLRRGHRHCAVEIVP